MFPRVALLLFPVGAAARNHALLREEAGPQLWAALPLTCADPLPLVEALGPHPFLTPHMLMTYLLPDSQAPVWAWREKLVVGLGLGAQRTRFGA